MKRAAWLWIALSVLPAVAAQPPQHVQMDFSITSGAMDLGEGRDVLEHDGKHYSVVSESKTVGVAAFFYKLNIRRESRGLVTADGLRPLHFEEERTRKPKRSADFDWESKTVRLADGDTVQTLALQPNTFDQTSLAYAFAFALPNREKMTVFVADGRRVSDYDYRTVGKEVLKTPLGELQTLHMQKVQDADDKRGFEFWLATDHHYLPVRIRYIEKNGTVVDSTVTAITYR